jgi:transposase-like protein
MPWACRRCGKIGHERPAHAPLRRYCSKACQENRQTVGCTICGAPLSVQANRVDMHNYCGPRCTKEGRRRSWEARSHGRIPDAATLRRLYHIEGLSLRAIAERFGVRHISVRRWFRKYGLEPRATGRGLAHYGRTEPTRDELQRLVHQEYRSYQQIGALFNVDPAAVGHWLVKHKITRPTAWQTRRKGATPTLPTASELRALYERGLSTNAIGQLHGVSGEPIRRLCKEFGIALRDAGWNGLILCDDGHRVRSSYEFRVDNWLTARGVAHTYEPVLPFDRRCKADFLANGWYIEIWGVLNDQGYRRRRERKCLLYRQHGLALIEIGAHAFAQGQRGLWERRLAQCLNPRPSEQPPRQLQIPA